MSEDRSKYGTNFTESEIFLAMTVGDFDYASVLVSELSSGEKLALVGACEYLADMCRGYIFKARA